MAQKPNILSEPFKKALTHSTRALAENPELEIVFGSDGPRFDGDKLILPHPPRDLNPKLSQRVRGQADRLALRAAHHDAALHARARPQDDASGEAFDAMEAARLDAIGARAMRGVRQNLLAAQENDVERSGLTRKDGEDVAIADVLGLLAREAMTGDPVPAGVERVVNSLRGAIAAKAGGALDELARVIHDQKAFDKQARAILTALDMTDDSADARRRHPPPSRVVRLLS